MAIKKKNGQWGVDTWVEGFKTVLRELGLEHEAEKNPEAVFNRLCRQERWEEAELVLECFV